MISNVPKSLSCVLAAALVFPHTTSLFVRLAVWLTGALALLGGPYDTDHAFLLSARESNTTASYSHSALLYETAANYIYSALAHLEYMRASSLARNISLFRLRLWEAAEKLRINLLISTSKNFQNLHAMFFLGYFGHYNCSDPEKNEPYRHTVCELK